MMNPCRHLTLTGLTLMLQIDHSALAPEQRVEASAQTTELLRLGLQVDYRGLDADAGFRNVFNYAPLVAALRQPPWSCWDQPMEDLAEALVGKVLECAQPQNIALEQVVVQLSRPELAGLCVTVESCWAAPASP